MIIGVFSAPTLVSQSFVGNDFNNIDGNKLKIMKNF